MPPEKSRAGADGSANRLVEKVDRARRELREALVVRQVGEGSAGSRTRLRRVCGGPGTRPTASDAKWPRNAIDRFILARLDKETLKPQAEADRYALVRRVSLDVTGLPPTVGGFDQFVNDRGAPTHTKNSWTGCWRSRRMASIGRACGWIWRATRIRAAMRATRRARFGRSAITRSNRSTRTSHSINSQLNRLRAICLIRRKNNSSRRRLTATR